MSSRESPEVRRRHLLEVGTKLWAGLPFDAISTSEIVAASGVSIGLVYHYFGSKRGYYVATVRKVAEELLDYTHFRAEDSLNDAIRGAIRAFLGHLIEHPGLYRATLRGGLGFDPEVQSIAEKVRWTIVDRIQGRRPKEEQQARDRRLVYGWLGFLEFVALDWAEHRDVEQVEIETLALDSLGRILA